MGSHQLERTATTLSVSPSSMRRTPLIEPTCTLVGIDPALIANYVDFIETLLSKVIPSEIVTTLLQSDNPDKIYEQIQALRHLLPIISWECPEKAPCTLAASFLGPSNFTGGVGRYVCDTLSKWLVPGQFLNISSVHSLNFRFLAYPRYQYFFQEIFIDINTTQALEIIRNHQDMLKAEMRINVLAVKHARGILSAQQLSSEEKQMLIEENIQSVMSKKAPLGDTSVFDQMQHFLLSISLEDRISQIKDKFGTIVEQRPAIFDTEIFNDIKHFILLFKDLFTVHHDLRHLSRLIAFQHIFRKNLKAKVGKHLQERHLLLKLLRTQSWYHPNVLGILGGITIVKDNEIFEERHLLQALQKSAFHTEMIENSLVIDRRGPDPIRIFYVEIKKKSGAAFSLLETRELRKTLERELLLSVETVAHPVFMPRNEEEIFRNILILNEQLKFVTDIPQVILSFDMQTEQDLSFTVILLRLLKKETKPLPKILEASDLLRLQTLEVKHVGKLRKKYIKEANVFSLLVRKKQFLRNDYSLDLFRARQAISAELDRLLGGFRDFNGGILSKQQEAFEKLQQEVPQQTIHPDLLLENFFYNISPPIQQSLLPTSLLKILFAMKLEALESSDTLRPFFLKTYTAPGYFLLLAASTQEKTKELLIKRFPFSADLFYTHVTLYGIHCVGYIYQTHDPVKYKILEQQIQNLLIHSS